MIEAALICGFAGWRLASLLCYEEGPLDIFVRLRVALDAEGPGELRFWRALFSCVWCMSVWTVLAMGVLWEAAPWLPMIIAAMGLAIVVEQWVRRPSA